MLFDYHVHCALSADCDEPLQAYEAAARSRGVDEFCFTDHFEYGYPDIDFTQPPLADRLPVYEAAGFPFRFGVEAGMNRLGDANARLDAAIASAPWLDFVIASTHVVDGADPYFPHFFEKRTREQAFQRYLSEVLENIRSFTRFCVVGHIDYPSKGCPYEDKMLRYGDAPDVLDDLFRLLAQRGQGLEINTSIFNCIGSARVDLVWLRRYRELGGEIVTIGSDSHGAQRLGEGFADALELLRSAGLRYVCTFEKMKPIFHAI